MLQSNEILVESGLKLGLIVNKNAISTSFQFLLLLTSDHVHVTIEIQGLGIKPNYNFPPTQLGYILAPYRELVASCLRWIKNK